MPLTLDKLATIRKQALTAFGPRFVVNPSGFVIAGGAVRDTVLNRPVRDIDIFIDGTALRAEWHDNDRELRRAIRDFARVYHNLPPRALSYWEHPGEGVPDFINKTPERVTGYSLTSRCLEVGGFTPVQFIVKDAPLDEVLAAFPLSLSQCWIDGAGFHATPAFRRDREAATLRYVSSEPAASHLAYCEKIAVKYPTYRRADWVRMGA